MAAPDRDRRRHDDEQSVEMIRSEEELRIETETVEAGSLRLHKHVEEHDVHETVPRAVEHADVERIEPAEDDSGEIETLPDGSVSIPILEEEIVITKRLVVRERIVVHKRTTTEQHRVDATLRAERVEVEADDSVDDRVQLERTDESARDPHSTARSPGTPRI